MARQAMNNTKISLLCKDKQELSVVRYDRDCDNYMLAIKDFWCDGVAVIPLTLDELKQLGEDIRSYVNKEQ